MKSSSSELAEEVDNSSFNQSEREQTVAQKNEQSHVENIIKKASLSGKYSSEKKNLQKILTVSLSLNAGLIVVLIFFAISFASVLSNRDVSIIIPPGTHEDLSLSFGSTRVNRPVFNLYADYLSRGFGNFNYENVDKVFDNLLEYADGSVKHQMHSILANKAKIVKDNFVTQTFRLQRVELDRDARGTLAKCYGYATRKVGKQIQFENIPYLLTFWFKSYRGNAAIVGMRSEINKNSFGGEKLKVDQYETDNKYINF